MNRKAQDELGTTLERAPKGGGRGCRRRWSAKLKRLQKAVFEEAASNTTPTTHQQTQPSYRYRRRRRKSKYNNNFAISKRRLR